MKKFLIYSDCHFSQYSSIIRSRGDKYSTRLHNLINSISWAEHLAEEQNCTGVICLGDFWDKPNVVAEELTALQDTYFSNLPHTFITGNHDANISNLEFSSIQIFKSINAKIITDIEREEINDFVDFYYIPYLTNSNFRPLKDIVSNNDKKKVIFSHNDIAGIQYGKFISQNGFEVEDILNNCTLFLNGHLHNSCTIQNKIVLVGNLTGQNFTEDATKYDHCAYTLEIDGDKIILTQYINPYAFNFYKLIINNNYDLNKLKNLKSNPILSVSCNERLISTVKPILDSITNTYRLITLYSTNNSELSTEFKVEDHLQQFIDFVQTKIDNSSILTEELSILGGSNAD